MKTITTLLLFLLASISFAQTIRRVNPDTKVKGTNVYNTLQAAHDAASNGDIIIVEPSNSTSTVSTIGDLTSIKKLTIYGSGYFKQYNSAYSTLIDNTYNSAVENITFSIGSEGSKVQGIGFNQNLTIKTSNITVSGCAVGAFGYCYGTIIDATQTNITNLIFERNYLCNVSITGFDTKTITTCSFRNNFMNSISFSGTNTTAANVSNMVIDQNTFSTNSLPAKAYGTIFTNNIFLASGSIVASANFVNSSFNYNVSAGTISPSVGSNNQTLANLSNQFKSNSGGSPDNNYQIINGSLLLTASSSSGQVGMFGGTTPYLSGGLGVGPTVTKIGNTGVGNNTTAVTVTVSGQANY